MAGLRCGAADREQTWVMRVRANFGRDEDALAGFELEAAPLLLTLEQSRRDVDSARSIPLVCRGNAIDEQTSAAESAHGDLIWAADLGCEPGRNTNREDV